MNKPTVVNCMREACTHYCGRPYSLNKAKGRPRDLSALGNPFPMKDESEREKVIEQFRERLQGLLSNPEPNAWKQILLAIPADARLGCFCAPRPCHCDVIVEEWVKLQPKPNQTPT